MSREFILICFMIAASAAATLIVHAVPPRFTILRKIAALVALPIIVASGIGVVVIELNIFTVLLVVLGLYQLFNTVRVIKGRMHALYLWHATFRTAMWLITSQFALVLIWAIYRYLSPSGYSVLFFSGLFDLIVVLVCLLTIIGHTRRMRNASRLESIRDSDLPSLTIAIPARNETDALHDCITSLLASHYPKLEILVLDDCSQTTRTPEIIRSFAHAGVRFIQGVEPHETWLAKNQSYAALADAASGEIVLFAGVDIRFEPGSIRQLVGYALAKHKSMLSIMPLNSGTPAKIPLIQPMRYLWELALPRKAFDRPPVLSSCWLITKQALRKAGGFEAAKRMVVPESYFAKQQLAGNGYSFLAGGDVFGVISDKEISEQRDTAVRVGYPQLHRRPEVVAIVSMALLGWIGLPIVTLVARMRLADGWLEITIALSTILASCYAYTMILRLGYGRIRPIHVASLPLAVAVYVGLLHYSMYKYEFSEVIWKDRNVCIPVMHVVPSLPKI